MAIFNKILNILIFILAGVSVTFGYFLFEKRKELRMRGDKMAQVIHSVSKTLDDGSNTKFNEKLLIDKRREVIKEKDGYKPTNKNISLWHNNYNNLTNVLRPFEKQAVDIIAQREQLSKTLHNVLEDLKLPIANEFEAPTFMDVTTYGDQDTKLLDIVKRVTDRDETINRQIEDSVKYMDGSLDHADLWDLEGYKTPLETLKTVAEKLKDRKDYYETSIGQLYKIFLPNKQTPDLSGEDYASQIDLIKTAMDAEKQKFDQTVIDLAQTRKDLQAARNTIEEKEDIIRQRNDKIVELKNKLKIYIGEGKKEETFDMAKLKKELRGRILRVNDKWGFVVIDLGLNNKMIIGDKKKVTKIVPLDTEETMLVARGSRLMGKIFVTKVAENCAIANIVPESMTGKMEVGDEVYFKNENKSLNKEIMDKKIGEE